MKNILHTLFAVAIIFGSYSCKSKKETASKAPETTVVADDVYRLWVSFYSAGEGIDLATIEQFKKFIDSQAKKIAYEETSWGREGEVDYCLKLSELNSAEQADFIKNAKELLSKSKLVHVEENKKCVHKQ